jgi:hypothetical protein
VDSNRSQGAEIETPVSSKGVLDHFCANALLTALLTDTTRRSFVSKLC